MAKEYEVAFRTLLTESEYLRLVEEFKGAPSNFQTNYYFDTRRFSLKAAEVVLRVKKRDKYELGLKRKKGYTQIDLNEELSEEEFNNMVANGLIYNKNISQEVNDLIKDQLLVNYLTLSTYRIFMPYKHGLLAIDKVEYLGTIDYELEFQASSRDSGKRDFIETVKELNIVYKKADSKIKRAYNALKRI